MTVDANLERRWYRAVIASNLPGMYERFWQEVLIARLIAEIDETFQNEFNTTFDAEVRWR